MIKAFGALVVMVLVALFLAFCSVHIVPSGHVGVVKMYGEVQDEVLGEGLHWLSPVARVTDFNVRFESATAKHAEGGTSDLQEVFEDLTVNYGYDPKHASYVFRHFGVDADIEQKFIIPALFESFKAVTSQYTAEQLVTERVKVSTQIVNTLQTKLEKYRIIVSDINVQNFAFDPQFAAAVRGKVVAGQNKLTAEQNLETARIATEQKVVEAQGNAKAIAIQAQAVENQGGDKFIALEAIKKWNGQLPATFSGGAIPFLTVTK